MSAHDVRQLDVCAKCARLGSRGHGLIRAGNVWVHPGCLAEEELLELPHEQLRTVRLCDVSTASLLRILAALDAATPRGFAEQVTPGCVMGPPLESIEEKFPQ